MSVCASCLKCFIHVKSQFWGEKTVLSMNVHVVMLQHLIINFCSIIGQWSLTWDLKLEKCDTLSTKSGHGCLREVFTYRNCKYTVIWLGISWYFGKPVSEERWLLTTGGRNWRFNCIWWWQEYFKEHWDTSQIFKYIAADFSSNSKRKMPLSTIVLIVS